MGNILEHSGSCPIPWSPICHILFSFRWHQCPVSLFPSQLSAVPGPFQSCTFWSLVLHPALGSHFRCWWLDVSCDYITLIQKSGIFRCWWNRKWENRNGKAISKGCSAIRGMFCAQRWRCTAFVSLQEITCHSPAGSTEVETASCHSLFRILLSFGLKATLSR